MQCKRLIGLVKEWYMRVQEETMAPARMVAFVEQHIERCEECQGDPEVKGEAKKIREIVLPPSKVPKPKAADDEDFDEETIEEEGDGDGDGDEDEDDDEEMDGEVEIDD